MVRAAKHAPNVAATRLGWWALGPAALAVAGLAAYSNSFSGPFVFDGEHLLGCRAIQSLTRPLALVAENQRPVGYFSFAINHAVHGYRVGGFHAVNLAIHIAAALALFGIVRRTLIAPRLAGRYSSTTAYGLALAASLLWLVHPLQTQSVTYIYQRLESLMGLFVLLALYCFTRGTTADAARPGRWLSASVAACFLAVGTKEVAVVAPVLILWYDRVFVAASWREIFARRRWYYAALAGSWLLLAALILSHWKLYPRTGLLVVPGVAPWDYAASQPGVILHYLRLVFWPVDQCIDYDWPVARSIHAILWPTLAIAALVGATIWAVFRKPEWGFVAGCFFLILSPTSSIVPIRDLAFEHRMYLPLAAVTVLVVVGGYELLRSARLGSAGAGLGALVVALVAPALAVATFERNRLYADEILLWKDVLRLHPTNARAHVNLGNRLDDRNDHAAALAEFRQAVELRPKDAVVHYSLATSLAEHGVTDEAIKHFHDAIQLDPNYAAPHYNLGSVLASLGQFPDAIRELREAVRLEPEFAPAHNNLGNALRSAGMLDEAVAEFREAIKHDPRLALAHFNLGLALEQSRDPAGAEAAYREALRLKPNNAAAHNNLGNVLLHAGRLDEAILEYQESLRIDPQRSDARLNLEHALGVQRARAK